MRFSGAACAPAWQAESAEAGMRVRRIETRVDLVSGYAGADDRFVR